MSNVKNKAVADEDSSKENGGDLKRPQRSADSSSDEDSDYQYDESDQSDDEFIDQEIQVEFEAYPPHESDYDGSKKLLKQLFLKADIDTGAMTDHLLSLQQLTVVIKQSLDEQEDGDDDEDEVYGIMSLYDISASPTPKLKNYFCSQLGQEAEHDTIRKLFDSSKLGLIINERYVNLPPKLCVPAFESLAAELKKPSAVQFEQFVMIVKLLKAKRPAKEQKKKKGGGKVTVGAVDELIYLNAEEELFDEKAAHRFEFSVANQCDGDQRDGHWNEEDSPYEPFRKVLILNRDAFFETVSSLANKL